MSFSLKRQTMGECLYISIIIPLSRMAKKINKEVESAIRWFAAEYHFLEELAKELQKIEEYADISRADKNLRKALQFNKYIGRAEKVAERKINLVKEDLSALSSTNKQEIAEIVMAIEIPEKELIKGSSRYLGSLADGIKHLRILIKQKEKHPEIKALDNQFKREERSLIDEVKNLERWLSALELSLKNLSRRRFIKNVGALAAGAAVAGVGYYAERKFHIFHRMSGLLDRLIFSNKEVHKLKQKGVFITIDDGPWIHNDKKDLKMQEEEINLDLNYGRETFSSFLKYFIKQGIFATFFFVGKRLQIALKDRNYKNLIIYAIKKGFVIGNHSYSHTPFSQLSMVDIYEEIRKTDELIEGLYLEANVKRPAKLFRFPYGDRPKFTDRGEVYAALEKLNYELWFWGRDTEDWKPDRTTTEVLAAVNSLHDGDIILIHERPKTVKEFLDPLCKVIEKNNLSFGNYLA